MRYVFPVFGESDRPYLRQRRLGLACPAVVMAIYHSPPPQTDPSLQISRLSEGPISAGICCFSKQHGHILAIEGCS